MIRKLSIIGGGILLALVLLVVGIFIYIDSIAATAVERGGTYALGVDTRLADADVGIFAGEVTLDGLTVDNPEGFKAKRFLGVTSVHAQADLSTLRSDTVEIPLVRITGAHVHLEKREGKANYQIIIENLQRLSSKKPDDAPADESGKRYVIRELIIEDAQVTAQVLPIGGDLTTVTAPLDTIRLENVGEEEGGVKMSRLVGVVTQALLAGTVKKAGELPGQIGKELGKGLEGIGKIAGGTIEIAGEALGEVGKAAGKVIDGIGKGLEDVGKGIGDLLGGNKDDEEK